MPTAQPARTPAAGGDAFGGRVRSRALLIMKESRVGAFGALALVLVILAKVSLLALIGSIDTSPIACPPCNMPTALW